MLRALLVEGGTAPAITNAVIALVTKIVARNSDLERRLGEMMFTRGKKREGISAAQLLLFLDALDTESAGESATASEEQFDVSAALRKKSAIDERRRQEEDRAKNPPKQPPLRRAVPNNLRRVIHDITVPESERTCPTCGKTRTCIGHDVTEIVELIPAEVIVKVERREKLACQDECESGVVRAPIGEKVVSRGKFGCGFVAQILVEKYRDGLPLHRQKHRFARLGLDLAISTIADQVKWGTDLLRPVWHAARDEVLAAPVMHLDGTGLPVLDRDSPRGVKFGALWGYVGGDAALYLYASTGKKVGQRPGELGPEDFLRMRRGYTVADASSLFDESFKRPELIECGCNMHARRYFTKALDAGDSRAALPLAAFKKIYENEGEVRDADEATRLAMRQENTRPVYDSLEEWCITFQKYEPPTSPLGKAIQYLLNHRLALRRFLDDAVIPIDNGAVERLHVRTALTRKNFLFAGSDDGAERAAIAYTVLGCCQLADVNPVEYVEDVFRRLSRGVEPDEARALLPAQWKASRSLASAA